MNIREIIEGALLYDWILLGLFLTAFITQMGIYLFVFLKLPLYNRKKKSAFSPGISVIICAKNEELNLEHFLPHVLQQDYPEYEVVVVNDSSTDDTEHVLMQLAAQFDQLRYTSIPVDDKLKRGKKLALTIGLKAAKYDHVLLSDADCYPVSDHWLQRMASNFSEDHKIVLGYGGYERRLPPYNISPMPLKGIPIWEWDEISPMKKPSFSITKDLRGTITFYQVMMTCLLIRMPQGLTVLWSSLLRAIHFPCLKPHSAPGSSRKKDICLPGVITSQGPGSGWPANGSVGSSFIPR